ncbi:MAG TPA: sugar transferase [Candidatus Hydrogenedentes bacterium]|nr:sugar transferase [Candidatus Hydrogenedentota bacterium]HNT89236.1 sugar transferase [Candidatus Hydrogenedentota bacterium]
MSLLGMVYHDHAAGAHGHEDQPGVAADGGLAQAPAVRKAVARWMIRIQGLDRVPLARTPLPSIHALPLDLLEVRPSPWWKRVMDVCGALTGIILLAPLMLLVAAAVRLSSSGPAIFKQQRGGRGGKPFTVYKFRTMVRDAEARKAELMRFNERKGPVFKMTHDPRVTRVGRMLRCLSLDELPQLFNVLKGDMSLVGPRPLPVAEDRASARWQRGRLAVKPGITGLWQVSSRDKSCFDHWVRLDLRYIENLSFWLDLKILLWTIPAVLSRRGAH